MDNETSAKEIWKKRWKQSFDKWDEAVELTSQRITFTNKRGFQNLIIVGKCGYCEEFLEGWNCSKCSLCKKKVCSKRPNESTFWKYVREMQKGINDASAVDWFKALHLAKMMRDTIEEDGLIIIAN